MIIMDDIDERLIAELKRDSRLPLSELAHRLGLARATVRARIARLVAAGDIAGFTLLTRADVTPAPVRALTMISIEGRGIERITARLTGLPEVRAVHSTNGRWDLIVELATRTLPELDSAILRIRNIDGIMTSETSLLLSTRGAG